VSALDPDTLHRVRARDPEALEAFFEHYFDRAYGFAVHLVGDVALADDLVQEAFVKMHGAIDRIDPQRDPSAWVFTIVRNCARDHWRSRAFRTSQQNTDIDEAWDLASPDSVSNPHDLLERKEDVEAVRDALQQLSPADREVLLLKEFQGLSTAEIARVLDRNPEAVRQRHSRAVRRLGQAYRSRMSRERRST
jgi:RNA polymerase sigma-70 factor (ECF subfamily)